VTLSPPDYAPRTSQHRSPPSGSEYLMDRLLAGTTPDRQSVVRCPAAPPFPHHGEGWRD
jgi:hypothetical protein